MLQQVMIVLPISFVLSVIGAVWLLLSRKFRAAGIAFIVFFAGMFALSAKNYYLGPVYPMMFGAAGVALEQWTRNRMRWIAIGAVALNCVSSVLALPLAIPILSPEKFIAYQKAIGIQEPKFENQKRGALPQIYADMFGWEDMVKTTAAFYHTLTPEEQRNTAIFGDTYGEAGALSFWAKKYGLPEPIGPHQTFWIWGPRDYHRADMINVGSRDDRALRASCDSVTVIGHADNPLSRPDTHFDIYYCKGFHYDFQELWPRLKRFR
jgi:hypothetical protein